MPTFTLLCENYKGDKKTLYYDTEHSTLVDEKGIDIVKPRALEERVKKLPSKAYDKNNPAVKSDKIKVLKISLGLSCNYSCSYCSQRFVPEADNMNKAWVDNFIKRLDTWFWGGYNKKGSGVHIELWGGEPFVYWKTIQPLVAGLKEKYPNLTFSTITNASLLDDEKVDWIIENLNSISISHDGVGYHLRGEDPLDKPEIKKHIMRLYRTLAPQQRISINPMLNKENMSRKAIQEFLEKVFDDGNLVLGEGGFIDAYDEGAVAVSLTGETDRINFRRMAIHEIRNNQASRFAIVKQKISSFVSSLVNRIEKNTVIQKCGIDQEDNLIVDLRGNVITCQNVSSNATAPNGNSHKVGSVYDYENIKLNTVKSWQNRANCFKCPVLHLCQGSCTFLEDDLFQKSCDNSFSDNVVFLAAAVEKLTGYLPVKIIGEHRKDRHDIWGLGI